MPTLDAIRLETPRLILRLPHRNDLDRWVAMMQDEEAARFIGGVTPRALSWRALMTVIGAWHAHGFAMFAIVEKATGRWVGRLGQWMPEGRPGPEIGWALVRERWGRGYATEGARAATDWAFDHLGWDQVIHSIHPENVASWRWRGGWARATWARACGRRPTRARRPTSGAIAPRVAGTPACTGPHRGHGLTHIIAPSIRR
jgi:RimJ/RimL family protein N-acetyltransferase